MALLNRNQKIWVVFHCRLETSAVILEEIVVHTSAASWHIRVFYCRAVHVDEPAGSCLAGLEARKAEGFIDAVGQSNGLEFLIL